MTNVELKNKLQAIADQKDISIEKEIALEALNHTYEELENFFSDLLNHGCVSGVIGSLMYLKDTHTFFDTHYGEIEELREEFESSTGQEFTLNGDLKNTLAWFAFEQVAHNIAMEFGLEV